MTSRRRSPSEPPQALLSRRERQIIDVVYRLGEASVADVAPRLPDKPAANTVRVTMAILEKKGFLKHREDGPRYVYAPTVPLDQARRSALQHLLRTFFKSSPSTAMLTLLDMASSDLSRKELDQLAASIDRARKES